MSIWLLSYAAIGYYFGEIIEANMSRIKEYEFYIMVFLIAASLLVFYLVRKRNLRKLQALRPTPPEI